MDYPTFPLILPRTRDLERALIMQQLSLHIISTDELKAGTCNTCTNEPPNELCKTWGKATIKEHNLQNESMCCKVLGYKCHRDYTGWGAN